MVDSVTTKLPTAHSPQETFPNYFPFELFKFIFDHSNVISLMHLSATSHVLRRQVHNYFVFQMSDQATTYPEVREGLARLDWSKDNNLWTCSCFKLMAGPGFAWRRLNERKGFFSVCSSGTKITEISTTVAGKTFVITSFMELIYWKIPSYNSNGQNYPRTLVSFKNSQIFIKCLSSYDNVLVISLSKSAANRSITISIYNPSTLRRITDVEVKVYDDRISEGDERIVKGIVFAKDTMILRLDYRVDEELATEFQIWKINTKEPQEEGISLSNTISYRNSPLSQFLEYRTYFLLGGNFCANDRYIVILDDDEVKVVQRNEEAVLTRQLGLGGKRLRGLTLEKGQGDFITLAFGCYSENYVPKLVVQVFSASRGDLVIQKEVTPCSSLRYMEWFGHNLVVILEHDGILTRMLWQQGLASFLTCPLSVSMMKMYPDSGDWKINCLNLDYRGITSSAQKNDGNGNQVVCFQTWDSC